MVRKKSSFKAVLNPELLGQPMSVLATTQTWILLLKVHELNSNRYSSVRKVNKELLTYKAVDCSEDPPLVYAAQKAHRKVWEVK